MTATTPSTTRPRPKGRTNRNLLDAQPNCENVIDLAAERDPTRGISWQGNGTKNGSERNDRLNGQHGNNKLYGNGGDDVLWGDAAHDSGGARALKQKDFISGGAGDDTIYSGRGTNTVLGGDGNDYLQGNGVASRLDGGNGNDTIRLAGQADPHRRRPGRRPDHGDHRQRQRHRSLRPGQRHRERLALQGQRPPRQDRQGLREQDQGLGLARKAPARRQPSHAGPSPRAAP